MKKIIVITTGWFPEGDAGAVRLNMIGKAFELADFHITVLCRGKIKDKGYLNGISYISLRKRSSKFGKLIDYFFFPNQTKKYLKANKSNIDGVYIYNAHIRVFKFCKKFCKKNGIKLIYDCVEWYSPEEFKLGCFSFDYLVKNYINTRIIDSSFSVIAISKYLEEYFKSKNIQTLKIPILCDPQKRTNPKAKNGEKLTLFYAGAPVKKDLVGNVLEAVLLLPEEERKRIKITFIGTTRDYLIRKSCVNPETIDKCLEIVELCGRVPRDEVLRRMEEADFVFLPRDAKLRYAKAGFPSKVIEAMANATPIFCNISSDLGDFLKDGKNAIISKSHTPEDLAQAIERAIELTPEQKNIMSKNALETATNLFDYRLYSQKLSDFFNKI